MEPLDRIILTQLQLPLRRAFTSATGSVAERSVILVEVEREGVVGLGEAAPYPAHTPDDIERAWITLGQRGPQLLTDPSDRSGLSLTAAAAFDQAVSDLAARIAGVPLWRHLGGRDGEVTAGWVAAGGDTIETLTAAQRGWEAGHRAVKVKIAPTRAVRTVSAVTDLLGDMQIGADANGSFPSGDTAELRAIDDMGLAYLEQPFPPASDDRLAQFRNWAVTPVALDESVSTPEQMADAITQSRAPILVVKAGHLGSRNAVGAIAQIVAAGLVPRVGGLVETGVGRGHALALATLHPEGPAPDLISGSYFVDDPAPQPFTFVDGRAHPPPGAGIGIDPDRAVVQRFAVRRSVI